MIISHATTAFLLHVATSVKQYNLLNPVFESIRSPLQMAAHYAVSDARSCQAIQSQIQTTYASKGEDSTRACLDTRRKPFILFAKLNQVCSLSPAAGRRIRMIGRARWSQLDGPDQDSRRSTSCGCRTSSHSCIAPRTCHSCSYIAIHADKHALHKD